MLCYQKNSNVEELKDHIISRHTYNPSEPPLSPDSCLTAEEDRQEEENQEPVEDDDEEEEEGEEEDETESQDQKEEPKGTSDLISNMLGTQPAVIDHLLSSKASSEDAAKLLGVR